MTEDIQGVNSTLQDTENELKVALASLFEKEKVILTLQETCTTNDEDMRLFQDQYVGLKDSFEAEQKRMEVRIERKNVKVQSLNDRIDELKQELQDADAEVLRAQTQMLNNAVSEVQNVDESILD